MARFKSITVNVNVDAVNDAPALTMNQEETVKGDGEDLLVQFTVKDPDSEDSEVRAGRTVEGVSLLVPEDTKGMRFEVFDSKLGCPENAAMARAEDARFQPLPKAQYTSLNASCLHHFIKVTATCSQRNQDGAILSFNSSDGVNITRNTLRVVNDCSDFSEILDAIVVSSAFALFALLAAIMYACYSGKSSTIVVTFLYRVTSPFVIGSISVLLQIGDLVTDVLVLIINVWIYENELQDSYKFVYTLIVCIAGLASIVCLYMRIQYVVYFSRKGKENHRKVQTEDGQDAGTVISTMVMQNKEYYNAMVLQRNDRLMHQNRIQAVFILLVFEDIPVAILNVVILQQDPNLLDDFLFRFSFIYGLVMAGVKLYQTLEIRTLRDELLQINQFLATRQKQE